MTKMSDTDAGTLSRSKCSGICEAFASELPSISKIRNGIQDLDRNFCQRPHTLNMFAAAFGRSDGSDANIALLACFVSILQPAALGNPCKTQKTVKLKVN